jgi:hypothetical protein
MAGRGGESGGRWWGAIMGHLVRWGRKRRGVSGVKRGGVQHHIWERRGQRSGTRLLEVVVVTVFGQLHPGEDGNRSGPTWQ